MENGRRIVDYPVIATMRIPVAIKQRLGVDRQGHALAVDGIVGNKTRSASYVNPLLCMHPLSDVALGEVVRGVSEEDGTNQGPRIREYMADEDLYPGPWCAAFVSWCLRQAYGMDTPYIRGARRLVDALPSVSLHDIQIGDVIGWERPGAPYGGHVGIVCEVTKEHIWTVEGNSGPHVRVFRYRHDAPHRGPEGELWGVARYAR